MSSSKLTPTYFVKNMLFQLMCFLKVQLSSNTRDPITSPYLISSHKIWFSKTNLSESSSSLFSLARWHAFLTRETVWTVGVVSVLSLETTRFFLGLRRGSSCAEGPEFSRRSQQGFDLQSILPLRNGFGSDCCLRIFLALLLTVFDLISGYL